MKTKKQQNPFYNLHIETRVHGVQVILDMIKTLAKSEIQTEENIHV